MDQVVTGRVVGMVRVSLMAETAPHGGGAPAAGLAPVPPSPRLLAGLRPLAPPDRASPGVLKRRTG
ncbi:hypothetical protein GCM10010315_11850 [Streptomyces luteosporeus]|uniref:Uncharacterized protein n=1 Tax=Streptomyces luteosporeus TaxID=173856 RepID=A0ABP6G122_9ACTN